MIDCSEDMVTTADHRAMREVRAHAFVLRKCCFFCSGKLFSTRESVVLMRFRLCAVVRNIICLRTIINAQSCTEFNERSTCKTSSLCIWIEEASGFCRCTAELKQDCLWNVDTSGSIGYITIYSALGSLSKLSPTFGL